MKKNMTLSFGALAIAFIFTLAPALAGAETLLTRSLQQGDKGADVGVLQTYLAKDATIYPQGLVTNYFGALTTSAVSNFQARNGLPTVGRVGPLTLVAINAKILAGSLDVNAAVIYNRGMDTTRNEAYVSWSTTEYTTGVVNYSTSPLITYERTNSVDISGQAVSTGSTLRASENLALTNLIPNTTYFYMITTTDQSGNVSVTLPATFQTKQ